MAALRAASEGADEALALSLEQRLRALAPSPVEPRPFSVAALEVLKAHLQRLQEKVAARFREDRNGLAAVEALSEGMDGVVVTLFKVAHWHFMQGVGLSSERLAVLAVGGFGRRELAPGSDIDIMFVVPRRLTAYHEQMVESVLYGMWDMKLKVGHTVLSLEDIEESVRDITLGTSLLDMRLVAGDGALFQEVRERLSRRTMAEVRDFITGKLEERDARHHRFGNTRFMLEPHIKDGKGGLRDLHNLYWIIRSLGGHEDVASGCFLDKLKEMMTSNGGLSVEEWQSFRNAWSFLTSVRVALHAVAGDHEDRLRLEHQQTLASFFRYKSARGQRDVERFMRHYFMITRRVGELTRVVCGSLRHTQSDVFPVDHSVAVTTPEGFVLDQGRLNAPDVALDAETVLRFFDRLLQSDSDIHPDSYRRMTRMLPALKRPRSNQVYEVFLQILAAEQGQERVLRLMNECGVLGSLVVPFDHIRAQIQFNMFHVYTTDEHTIRAVGCLNAIERGTLGNSLQWASRAMGQLGERRRALYVAMLLHDIGKGRGGDHSILGAEIAEQLCPQWGMSAEDTALVVWLVRDHLLMSQVATKQDLDDPETLTGFTSAVTTPERLRMLVCLTIADIRSIGPGVWNDWKGELLRKLFQRSESVLLGSSGDVGLYGSLDTVLGEIRQGLSGYAEDRVAEILALPEDEYFLSAHPEHVLQELKLALEAPNTAGWSCRLYPDLQTSMTRLAVWTSDMPMLFSKLAGAVALSGCDILDAHLHIWRNGQVMGQFTVRTAGGGELEGRHEQGLLHRLDQVLACEDLPSMPRRAPVGQRITFTPRVSLNNELSHRATVVEVMAPDGPGLLYRLAQALNALGLKVKSAKISTVGSQAVDVFYVSDRWGNKVHKSMMQEKITDSLKRVCEDISA